MPHGRKTAALWAFCFRGDVGRLSGNGGGGLGPTLEVALMLGPEALQAPITDPVGELDGPAAPGGYPAETRIALVAWVPRASADQHGVLPV